MQELGSIIKAVDKSMVRAGIGLTQSSMVNGDIIFTFIMFVAISVPLSMKLSSSWVAASAYAVPPGWLDPLRVLSPARDN
jgi:hypothetical protein